MRWTVSFTSSTGAIGSESRYKTGQHLPIIYDPSDEMPPMINQGLSIWMPPLLMTFVGLVFIGGSLLIRGAFGGKIVGG